MTALNIFLAVVGLIVTLLVLAGMMFLKPHHVTEAAVLTDLSDVQQRFGVSVVAEPVPVTLLGEDGVELAT